MSKIEFVNEALKEEYNTSDDIDIKKEILIENLKDLYKYSNDNIKNALELINRENDEIKEMLLNFIGEYNGEIALRCKMHYRFISKLKSYFVIEYRGEGYYWRINDVHYFIKEFKERLRNGKKLLLDNCEPYTIPNRLLNVDEQIEIISNLLIN